MGKLWGEKDIEATIQRLDRLTLDESRATAAQTLDVVYSLVQHKRAIMDGEFSTRTNFLSLPAKCSCAQMQTGMNGQVSRAFWVGFMLAGDNWLSPPDPWKNHNLAHESRHGGTGSWWIEGDTYVEWKSSDTSSLLWWQSLPEAFDTTHAWC